MYEDLNTDQSGTAPPSQKALPAFVFLLFFSVLLITAYVTMMRSPTVLTILPEGGDSRKQVMAVFILAAVGCGVFVTYTAALFFKDKAKDTGIFLALGASASQLHRQLFKELMQIAVGACLLGAALGTPLAFGIWKLFGTLLVNSPEMDFVFLLRPTYLPVCFCFT